MTDRMTVLAEANLYLFPSSPNSPSTTNLTMETPGYTPTPSVEGTTSYTQQGPSQSSYFPPYQPPVSSSAGPAPTSTDNAASSSLQQSSSDGQNAAQSSLDPGSQGNGSGRGTGRGRGRGVGRPGRTSTRLSTRTAANGTYGGSTGGSSKANVKSIKISFKGAGAKSEAEGGSQLSFLGEYDRELDEDPKDPLAFEEQFILRVPREIADGPSGLREAVKGKGKGLDGLEFKFLDSRRAAFTYNGRTYASKLVDLPNIIESQKTVDNRHLFKVADISQMLVVDHPVRDESSITREPLRVDDYFWPHGITPPMRHVRKRRFRKRLSRRTIEVVEEKVDELLRLDEEASETVYGEAQSHINSS